MIQDIKDKLNAQLVSLTAVETGLNEVQGVATSDTPETYAKDLVNQKVGNQKVAVSLVKQAISEAINLLNDVKEAEEQKND